MTVWWTPGIKGVKPYRLLEFVMLYNFQNGQHLYRLGSKLKFLKILRANFETFKCKKILNRDLNSIINKGHHSGTIQQKRSSHQDCLVNIHRKTTALESLFNKVADLQSCNCIIKRLQHRCFPASIAIILRTTILKNTCQRLLLKLSDDLTKGQLGNETTLNYRLWYS